MNETATAHAPQTTPGHPAWPAPDLSAKVTTAIPASFTRRAAAWVIDAIIIGIAGAAARAGLGTAAGLAIEIAVLLTYYALLEGNATGQTAGKRLLRIRVINTTGPGPVGVPRAALRRLCWLLSAIPCGLGFLWKLWDPQGMTWHDKLAGTAVIDAGR
jgi:uncharacterized RDD family membrane protein YckC